MSSNQRKVKTYIIGTQMSTKDTRTKTPTDRQNW